MIADIVLRKRDYDDEALFDPRGPLRRVGLDLDRHDGRHLGDRLGPGRQQLRRRRLVEQLAGLPARAARPRHVVDDPAGPYWEGNWPYANLGVLLALVLSFVVTLVPRRGTVRRQEAGT